MISDVEVRGLLMDSDIDAGVLFSVLTVLSGARAILSTLLTACDSMFETVTSFEAEVTPDTIKLELVLK